MRLSHIHVHCTCMYTRNNTPKGLLYTGNYVHIWHLSWAALNKHWLICRFARQGVNPILLDTLLHEHFSCVCVYDKWDDCGVGLDWGRATFVLITICTACAWSQVDTIEEQQQKQTQLREQMWTNSGSISWCKQSEAARTVSYICKCKIMYLFRAI